MTHQQQTAFENIAGKGEIARNEQFLLYPQCLVLNQMTVSPFVHIFDIMSLFAVEMEEPKTGISGKEFINDFQPNLTWVILWQTCIRFLQEISSPEKHTGFVGSVYFQCLVFN